MMGDVKSMNQQKRRSVFLDQLVTLSDLEEFKTELLQSIRQMLADDKVRQPRQWLKTYEVQKLLHVSAGTMQTLRNNGTLPYSKIGGIIYYDSELINKILSECKQSGKMNLDKRMGNVK